jgi:hypothetical protein
MERVGIRHDLKSEVLEFMQVIDKRIARVLKQPTLAD